MHMCNSIRYMYNIYPLATFVYTSAFEFWAAVFETYMPCLELWVFDVFDELFVPKGVY